MGYLDNTGLAYLWGKIKAKLVQPDWSQNDETAADYVKNRPGGYDEYDVNITWDGVVGDRVVVEGAGGAKIVHVSDEILTVDQINGSTIRDSRGNEKIISGITDADSVWGTGIAVFVSTPGWTFKGVTFPKAGVYFAKISNEYIASMTKVTTFKIPQKYLELPKGVMVVNFTQDDNGNWSADKNWDDAAALIESGGWVYAFNNVEGIICPCIAYTHTTNKGVIDFYVAKVRAEDIVTMAFTWIDTGLIKYADDGLDFYQLPYVCFDDDQSLAADQQAQARANIGLTPVAKTDAMTQSVGLDAETGELWAVPPTGDNIVLASSTAGSTKKFRLTVDDSGTLSAVEVTDAS